MLGGALARLVEMSEGAGKDLEKAARQRRGGILVKGRVVVVVVEQQLRNGRLI